MVSRVSVGGSRGKGATIIALSSHLSDLSIRWRGWSRCDSLGDMIEVRSGYRVGLRRGLRSFGMVSKDSKRIVGIELGLDMLNQGIDLLNDSGILEKILKNMMQLVKI